MKEGFGGLAPSRYPLFYDLDGNTMKAKFEAFVETLGPRDTVVVYFSGHGVEFQGEHFFYPSRDGGTR